MVERFPKDTAIMNIDMLELEGTKYFKAVCLVSKKNDEKWLARVRVLRRDTEEHIKAGFTIFGNGKESVLSEVDDKVKGHLQGFIPLVVAHRGCGRQAV